MLHLLCVALEHRLVHKSLLHIHMCACKLLSALLSASACEAVGNRVNSACGMLYYHLDSLQDSHANESCPEDASVTISVVLQTFSAPNTFAWSSCELSIQMTVEHAICTVSHMSCCYCDYCRLLACSTCKDKLVQKC